MIIHNVVATLLFVVFFKCWYNTGVIFESSNYVSLSEKIKSVCISLSVTVPTFFALLYIN